MIASDSIEWPVVCLVTDRLRLAQRLGLDPRGDGILDRIVEQAREAVDAGVQWIQIRDRELPPLVLSELTSRIVAVSAQRTRVIVNSRIDVAIARHAHGAHLTEQSPAPGRVRPIVPSSFLVGVSRHDPASVQLASGADYVIFGTVFPSRSKPDAINAGLEGLRAACRASTVPVLAIGGVSLHNSAQAAAAGAAGVAAIDLFLPPPSGERSRGLHAIVLQLREAFDSVKSVS